LQDSQEFKRLFGLPGMWRMANRMRPFMTVQGVIYDYKAKTGAYFSRTY
jgi:hypothetical protein